MRPGRRLASGRHCLCGPRPLPRPARPRHTHPPAGAQPSACAFVHSHPSKRTSSPPGRAPQEEGGVWSGPGASDNPPRQPAAGRVLLIHFPLALARPGRRRQGGARRKWALRSGGRSRPVRAPGGGADLRPTEGLPGGEGSGAPPPRD